MKALVYTGPGKMELQERPKPVPAEGEYLIKVMANGICGSDVEGFLGKSGRRTPPMIMGHEFAGVIEEAPHNGTYKVGQNVTAFPKYYCGECEICGQGLVNICPGAPCLGVLDFDGTMTEYITVKEKYLYPFSDAIDFTAASMVEPLAVAVRGAENLPREVMETAANILVIGAGTIGLLLVQALRLRGYKGKITVNDRAEFRLQKALDAGADSVFIGDDFDREVLEATGGRKFDASFECVGLAVTARASLNALKSGGTAVWIGNNQKMIEINMQQIVTSEIKVRGSYTYILEDFKKALRYIEEGRTNIKPIVTSSLPLDKGVEAFEALKNNREGKEIKIILTNG
jgi:L-iditol 2-dehydrogenase